MANNQAGSRGVDFSVTQLSKENTGTPRLGAEIKKPASPETLYGKNAKPGNTASERFLAIMKKWDEDGVGKTSPIQGKSSSVTGAKMNDDVSRVLDDYASFLKGSTGEQDSGDWVDEDYNEHRLAKLHIGDTEMSNSLEKLGALVWLSVINPQTKNAALTKTAAPKVDIKKLFKLLGLGTLGTLGIGAGGLGAAGLQTPEGQKAWGDIKQSGSDALSNISEGAENFLGDSTEGIQDMLRNAYGEAKNMGSSMLQGGAEAAGEVEGKTDELKDYMSDITNPKNGGLQLYSDIMDGIFGGE